MPTTLRHYLDEPAAAEELLRGWAVADVKHAHAALVHIASAGVPLDLLAVMCEQLGRHLPRSADPDMALNNLDRFVAAARNPLGIGTLFERDPTALATLVQIFSTSQHFSDLLVQDPEGFDLLRLTEGRRWPGRCSSRTWWPRSRRWSTSRRCCGPCGGSSAARRCGSPTAT